MAEIRPFKALRFTEKAGDIKELCCPPYDVISEEQRKAFLAANPYNVIRLELPKEGGDPYKEAASTLDKWLEGGIMAVDKIPSIYIYEEAFKVKGREYSIKGFICRVKLEEFSKGVILPHEETLSKAKADRFNLMCSTGCNFSQIYALYNDENGDTFSIIDKLSKSSPHQEFCDNDGVTHRLWIVPENEEVRLICRQFENRRLYIADGHHRYETALNYRNHLRQNGIQNENADYVMMMLVDINNPGLVVFPTHRIVRDLESFDTDRILAECQEYFEIEKISENSIEQKLSEQYGNHKKAFVYFDNINYYLLTLKDLSVMEKLLPGKSQALRGLDVSILHTLILEKIFGIDAENMAKQINLTYTRVEREAIEAVRSGIANCAFLLNPTRVDEIAAVAAAGEKMPQKSTYFYPKLITGLVMNKIL
ncbi:MAG TPA: DUF1015 domain-containing protein [Clostridiales bacterium]|nr:DUF1015 domain-containing protein [Clostridiales bacterium]